MTTDSIPSPLELELPRSVAQRPAPLLAEYIHAPPQSIPPMLRQLDSAAFYLAVRSLSAPPAPSSTAGCATQVYRDVVAKGPVNRLTLFARRRDTLRQRRS